MLERIESERLVIRCWRPEDAPALKDAIDSSLGQLREWVPWAMDEPSSVQTLAARLHAMRQQFVEGHDWAYGVFDSGESRLVGGAGLHPRGTTDHLEIGYWIRTDASGRGYATETAAALCEAAFAHTAVGRLEIHCDVENARSAAVAERLGFVRDRQFRQEAPTRRGSHRDTIVWTLFRTSRIEAAAGK
jgi:RimJ/RimL family protein N-acetyltransferase